MSSSKKELWFKADCEDAKGVKSSIWVYKKGRSIYLSSQDSFQEHLCHPSVASVEKIKSEIFLVFQTRVIAIN